MKMLIIFKISKNEKLQIVIRYLIQVNLFFIRINFIYK